MKTPEVANETKYKTIYPALTWKDCDPWAQYCQSHGYDSDISSHFTPERQESEDDVRQVNSLVQDLEESFKRLGQVRIFVLL